MKVFIGADHRGFKLKELLIPQLTQAGFEVEDKGAKEFNPEDDYVDFAKEVAESVLASQDARGVLICGSGVGVDMVANKIKGIRSALVYDKERAVQSRQHEDINVLCIPSDVVDPDNALRMITAFLETEFSGEERHLRRLEKVKAIEDLQQ